MKRNSKKFLLLVLCLFILGIFTTACGSGGKSTPPSYPFIPVPTPAPTVSPTPAPTPEPTPAKYQLELSQTEFTVNIGETDNITVTLNGEDITQTATYTVDQESIASVEQGLITGLSVGFATVTVHAENAKEDKTFTVNVIDPTLPTLEVSPTEVNLKIEKTSNVKVTLEGEDVTEKVNYKSDNESIATAEKGVVKAKDKKGSANIAVSLEGANSAIFKVNVKFNEIKLDKNILALLGYEKVFNGSNYDIKKIADGEIVKNLEIPATFTCGGTKYTITSIASSTFSNCSLESVTIPDTVTSIGNGTFSYCSSLKEIHIRDGVFCIFPSAFTNCSTELTQLTTKSGTIIDIPETGSSIDKNVTLICPKQNSSNVTGDIAIPEGVKEIPDYAFSGSSLTSIKIPNTVISIGSSSFFNCSKLESITLPDSVTSIGRFAFSSCSSLKEIHIGEGVLCIFPSAFTNCSTELTQLTTKSKKIDIPDGFHIDNDNNVTFIYVKQYTEEVIGNIEIPEGVTEISYNAFYECSSLKNITIPDSLITIGNCAFESCRSLESVTFGENSSLTTIGNSVFVGCYSLENITIPDSVISIGNYAFEGGRLKSVTFGENSNLTIIGSGAFYNYNPSLLTLDIPNSVTTIGEDAFKNVNNVNISEAQKELKGYSSKWGALHVNGE